MATPSGSEEQVRYDILIEAKAAIQAMKDIMRHTEDNTEKMRLFSALVLDSSERWGISWQKALNVYRQLNQELSKSKKATLFGQTGGQDLFAGTQKMLASTEQLRNAQMQTKKGMEELGTSAEQAGRRGARGMDVMRIALGAIVSMILFRAIQAVEMFFKAAIDQAKQFEETLYRLRNVEESLSLEGIEISMGGLKRGIQEIQKLLPIFSKEDVAQLVGNLAISTKQLGLNEQQILDLAKAVGILNIRSEKQEDLSTTAQHVLSSLLTGNAKGITALGIAFTDNVMRAKAMELGFLKAGEALSTLSENEKGLTKLNIILESTANEAGNISEYLDTNSAKLQENTAAWKDFQTTVGQLLLPFIPVLTGFIKLMSDSVNGMKVLVIELSLLVLVWGDLIRSIVTFKGIPNIEDTQKAVMEARERLVNAFFKEVPENAPQWFMKGWGNLIKEEAETATAPVQDLAEAINELDSDALRNKIEDIIEDTANAREDLEQNLSRKLEDLDTEYARKAEEAAIDLQRKLEDIDRDYAREKESILAKQRREDEKAEAEYQLRLWELRMRFLMDLEDALHARDARQVIRLQKQYKIDKEALARKHALEGKERNESQKAELEDLEAKRKQRIEDAKREYEQKLVDQQIAKQRELDDLNTWYAREQADIELAQQRKLETLLKGWIDEQKITADNAAEVYKILASYFGPGGMTDKLYQYMMQSLLANTVGAINQATAAAAGSLNALYGLANNVNPFQGGFALPPNAETPPSNMGAFHGFAEGGTLLATRPTRALFGEGGPELVNFTPLNRVGKNINKVFSNGNSPNGVGGSLTIQLDLSPDLEARVVSRSLDGVADVITKINRSKV